MYITVSLIPVMPHARSLYVCVVMDMPFNQILDVYVSSILYWNSFYNQSESTVVLSM